MVEVIFSLLLLASFALLLYFMRIQQRELHDSLERISTETAGSITRSIITIDNINASQLENVQNISLAFLTHIAHLEELLASGDFERYMEAKNPKKKEKSKNTIDDSKVDDIPLTDEMRVPILDGMKVKMEDEEEILPVNIY